MEERNSGLSLRSAIVIELVVIIAAILIYLFIGNNFFWKPAYTGTLNDKRFESIEKAIKKNPKSKNVGLAYALALYEKGENKAAADIFKKLYEKYPKDNAVLVNYAAFLKEEGEIKEAKKMYQRVLTNAPYFLIANIQYGVILREEGSYAEALKLFDNALKISPSASDVLVEKAKVYIAMNEKEKAKGLLKQALTYVPNYAEAQDILKNLN